MFCRTVASLGFAAAFVLSCGEDDPPPSDSTSTTATDDSTGGSCDVDEDGFRSLACGGSDCNDVDPAIHPEALDSPWTFGSVDAALVGDDVITGLAIDAGGQLHAVYSDGAEDSPQVLWHAVAQDDGTWTPTQVMTADGYDSPSIVPDATGVLRMAITVKTGAMTEVQIGTLSSDTWSMASLGEGTATAQALALDGSDALAAVTSTETEASYWVFDGSAWASELVGPLLDPILLRAFDGTMQVIGRADSVLQICERAPDTTWTCSDITPSSPTGAYGYRSRAAYDAGGVLHLVTLDNVDTARLVHRTRTDGEWETVMLSFLPNPLHGHSLVAAGGVLHVAAWSEPLATGALSYAQFAGGDWMLDETVIVGDRNGWQPSMALDTSGLPHVVFAETIQDDLLYGVRVGSDGVDQNCDGVDG